MHTAGRPRVAFERQNFSLPVFDKVKRDLSRKPEGSDKALNPIKGLRVVNVLKYDGGSLTCGKVRAIGSVRGQMPLMSHRVRTDLVAFDQFLGDPLLRGIERHRIKGLFNRWAYQCP